MGRAPKTPGVEIHLLLASQALELMGVSEHHRNPPGFIASFVSVEGP